MAAATTATFHPFPRLPAELRSRIWELTVEPRTVDLCVHFYVPPKEPGVKWADMTTSQVVRGVTNKLRSPTAVPAQLQTCREAREYLTTHPIADYQYEKFFADDVGNPGDDWYEPTPESDAERERYVWVNFENDTLSFGRTDLHNIIQTAHRVRRLRVEWILAWKLVSCRDFRLIGDWFRSLVEIHIVCWGGIRWAYKEAEELSLLMGCNPRDVYFCDTEENGGTVVNGIDLDLVVKRQREEEKERYRRDLELFESLQGHT